MTYILIGVAGFLGAILRYLIGFVFFSDSFFPITTLCINLSGSFLLARIMYSSWRKIPLSAELKTAIGTGFIGSFTTFSTFSVETVNLFQNGKVLFGFLYIFLSLFGGYFMAYLGVHMKKGELP